MEVDATEDPPASSSSSRLSSRPRVKSQRAIESEHVDRLLARAKHNARQQELQAQREGSASTATSDQLKKTSKGDGVGKAPKRKGKRVKVDEVYCICKGDGEDGRPMIECGQCDDWFHFDCISLSADEAERIHEYVCGTCEEATGLKTTHIHDIASLQSPSPPPGVGKPPRKRANGNVPKQVKRSPKVIKSSAADDEPEEAASSSTSSDDASSAEDVSSDSEDSGSDAASVSRPNKIRRTTKRRDDHAMPPPSIIKRESSDRHSPAVRRASGVTHQAVRKASTGGSGKVAELLPARQHVIKKLGEVIKGLFGGELSEFQSGEYAKEVEASMWAQLKDMVGGKGAAGGRYKAQFNLLASSLSKPLREDLRNRILDHTLKPAQVALLTSADLASEERLQEIEKARKDLLQQTVKGKDSQEVAAIRLGRDGLENVEDFREKEMKQIQQAEMRERSREEEIKRRRESLLSGSDIDDVVEQDVKSPPSDSAALSRDVDTDFAKASPGTGHRRSESIDKVDTPVSRAVQSQSPSVPLPSPSRTKSFDLKSAWGQKAGGDDSAGAIGVEESFGIEGEDQNMVDLSDIITVNEDAGNDLPIVADGVEELSEKERFEARPIVWSGGIINPANVSPNPPMPPVVARHISSKPHSPNWNAMLPQPSISITGRVPTGPAQKYISEARLSLTRLAVAVTFTLGPEASEAERVEWEAMIKFHIDKDRYGLYLPYQGVQVPPEGTKELYLIPLRPEDPSPEYTYLIDGFDLPTHREQSIFLGIFIASRDDRQKVPSTSHSAPSSSTTQPAPHQAPTEIPANPAPVSYTPTAGAAALNNTELQALMASLNPTAIQSLLPTPTHSEGNTTPYTPIVAGHSPYAGISGSHSPLVPQSGHGYPQKSGGPGGHHYPSATPEYSAAGYGHGYQQGGYQTPQSGYGQPYGGEQQASGGYGWNDDPYAHGHRDGSAQGYYDHKAERGGRGGREYQASRDEGWGSRGGRGGGY